MDLINRFGVARLNAMFASVPGFPVPGFTFPDITPLLEHDTEVYRAIIEHFTDRFALLAPTAIVCIDSFGYLFGAPVASQLGIRLILARRQGKLPRPHTCVKYDMVYDHGREICIHNDAVRSGEQVIVVDDFLATGGTSGAVVQLLRSRGTEIQSLEYVVELPECNGRAALEQHGIPIHCLLQLRLGSDDSWSIDGKGLV